jgi:hypothetical protein
MAIDSQKTAAAKADRLAGEQSATLPNQIRRGFEKLPRVRTPSRCRRRPESKDGRASGGAGCAPPPDSFREHFLDHSSCSGASISWRLRLTVASLHTVYAILRNRSGLFKQELPLSRHQEIPDLIDSGSRAFTFNHDAARSVLC